MSAPRTPAEPGPATEPAPHTAGPALDVPTLVLTAVVVATIVVGPSAGVRLRGSERWGTAATVFVSVVVQALPFLVLGVVVSGLLAAFATPERLGRLLPRAPAAAVCVAGVGGFALPGCECGSVPVARRLIDRGVPHAAALAFLLSAPAVNPVVLTATAVAFAATPEVTLARGAASLVCALVVGLVWLRIGRTDWIVARLPGVGSEHDHRHVPRRVVVAATARADLLTSGSYLVMGAAVVAVLHVALPAEWARWATDSPWAAVAAMVLLAVALSLCSEADAFVAAAMTAVPLLPRLVFLVVGPALDLKLLALYSGVLGRRFALRFAPVVLVVAVLSALTVGGAVLWAFGTQGVW